MTARGRRAERPATAAIVDTGPLHAAADADDAHHERALAVLSTPNLRLVIPTLVVVEATYLIGKHLGPVAEATFVDSLTDFVLEHPTSADWPRIADLLRQYRDFPLGTVDASIVALAERLNTDLIITHDQRHFRAIRPRHVPAFRLLPE